MHKCVCVPVCTLSVPGLLQVTVDFEAVVPRVSHHHMAIGGEGQALGTVERVCRCVDVGEERTTAIKHLREGERERGGREWKKRESGRGKGVRGERKREAQVQGD